MKNSRWTAACSAQIAYSDTLARWLSPRGEKYPNFCPIHMANFFCVSEYSFSGVCSRF